MASVTSFYSVILPQGCAEFIITRGLDELLVVFLYSCFVSGLLMVFWRASTQRGGTVPLGARAGRGEWEEADELPPAGGLTAAPPAWKTTFAISCWLLWGMINLCFWAFARLQVPRAGGTYHLVPPFNRELCLPAFLLMYCSTAAALLVVSLLDSAKCLSAFRALKSYGISYGCLLVTLSCSVLIHLLVAAGNGGSEESGPAGFEVISLFLLFLCLTGGMMLVLLGASAILDDVVPFQFGGARADENGSTLVVYSPEDNSASAPPQSSTIRPALMVVVLSCAGLVHLLVSAPATLMAPAGGSIGAAAVELVG